MPKLSIIEFLASRGSSDNLHKIGIKSKDKLADSLLKAHRERLRQRKNKTSLDWYYSNLEENREQVKLRQKKRREKNLEHEQEKRRKYFQNLDPERKILLSLYYKNYSKKWNKDNPEKKKEHLRRWRLKQKLRPVFTLLIISLCNTKQQAKLQHVT